MSKLLQYLFETLNLLVFSIKFSISDTYDFTTTLKEMLYFSSLKKITIMSRIVNIVFILTGGLIALYSRAEENQNVYILIGGIFLLMTGLYRLSKGISSNNTSETDSGNESEITEDK